MEFLFKHGPTFGCCQLAIIYRDDVDIQVWKPCLVHLVFPW